MGRARFIAGLISANDRNCLEQKCGQATESLSHIVKRLKLIEQHQSGPHKIECVSMTDDAFEVFRAFDRASSRANNDSGLSKTATAIARKFSGAKRGVSGAGGSNFVSAISALPGEVAKRTGGGRSVVARFCFWG